MADEKTPTTKTDEIEVEVEKEKAPAEDPQKTAVEVDLDEKKEDKLADVNTQLADMKKKMDGFAGVRRINERLEKELNELKKRSTPVEDPKPPVVPQGNELDQMVEKGNWQEAVSILAEKKAKELLDMRESAKKEEDRIQKSVRNLESAKAAVVAKYPELDPQTGDEDSVIHKAFIEALNSRPEYKQNDFGPTLAMMDMERMLKERGVDLGAREASANKEVIRRERADVTSMPAARSGIKGGKVIITQEQKEMADYHGIPYPEYARMLKAQEGGEGVTVQ